MSHFSLCCTMRTTRISAVDLSGFHKEKIIEGFENILQAENKHLAFGNVYEAICGTWQVSTQASCKGVLYRVGVKFSQVDENIDHHGIDQLTVFSKQPVTGKGR